MVIPTFNAAKHIERCLRSIAVQEVPPIEQIVVDGCSTDGTVELARRGATVLIEDCGIPSARLLGARAAHGEFVLNLDADQELHPDAIRRALETHRETVAFGEVSTGRGIIPFLNNVDRGRLHEHWQQYLDPVGGTIRPRFYRRTVLIRALEAIPPDLLRLKPGPYSEDSLIYVNSGVRPEEVGFVENSVSHAEVEGLLEFVRKWRNYGVVARPYRRTPMERFALRRAARKRSPVDALAGLPMVLLRGFPFLLGYLL